VTVTVQDVVRLRKAVQSRRAAVEVPPPSSAGELLWRTLAAGGRQPDPWQTAVADSDSKRQIVIAARQSGKSTVLASRVLHAAATHPDSMSLLISASERQAKELLAKFTSSLLWVGPAGLGAHSSQSEVRLGNGSRIVVLASSSNAVRGWTVTEHGFLCVDECAFTPRETWEAVVPVVVAHGGGIILTSSAGAVGSWPHEIHSRPDVFPQWERHTVSAWDIQRYDKQFLADEERRLPPDVFAAEYEGAWRNAITDAVIESMLIDRAVKAGEEHADEYAAWDFSDMFDDAPVGSR
jgi:hypothetical protein